MADPPVYKYNDLEKAVKVYSYHLKMVELHTKLAEQARQTVELIKASS